MFAAAWLARPDDEGGAWTNGDRFIAQELHKRLDPYGFTRTGFLCQAVASYFHSKNAQQLGELTEKVGRNRIQVAHGALDKMITVPHASVLIRELGGAERGLTTHIFDDAGHVVVMEKRKEIRELIEALVDKTNRVA